MYKALNQEEQTQLSEWFENAKDNFGCDVEGLQEALFGEEGEGTDESELLES